MSSLEQLMLDDKDFTITNTMYGGLLSSVSIPNMIMPFLGGALLDRSGTTHIGVLGFLICMAFGQIIFTLAMQYQCFWMAILGRIVFGIGEGSVVVGSRVIVSHWFEHTELTFAMGATVAIANISKMLAKSTVAPVALYFNSYVFGFWYSVLTCMISVVAGCVVIRYTRQLKKVIKRQIILGQPIGAEFEWLEKCIRRKLARKRLGTAASRRKPKYDQLKRFSMVFWLVALLHVVFINVFHLFQNVSSSFLYQRYDYTVVRAGVVSSFSHSIVVLAPVIGLGIDRFGYRMPLVVMAAVMSIVSYLLLIYTSVAPIVSMLLISFCLSFTPTALMASIPLSVPSSCFGMAFGIVEVTDAVGAAVGNLLIGYLRDQSGNYDSDMNLLLGMAIFSLFNAIFLWVYDETHDKSLHEHVSLRVRLTSVDDEDTCADIGGELGDSSEPDEFIAENTSHLV